MRDLKRNTFDCPICKSNLNKRDIKIEKRIKNIVDYFKEIKKKEDNQIDLKSQVNQIIANENSFYSKIITNSELINEIILYFFFFRKIFNKAKLQRRKSPKI